MTKEWYMGMLDMHGFKIQAGRVAQIFAKIHGGQGFQEKLLGGPLISGFIAFY